MWLFELQRSRDTRYSTVLLTNRNVSWRCLSSFTRTFLVYCFFLAKRKEMKQQCHCYFIYLKFTTHMIWRITIRKRHGVNRSTAGNWASWFSSFSFFLVRNRRATKDKDRAEKVPTRSYVRHLKKRPCMGSSFWFVILRLPLWSASFVNVDINDLANPNNRSVC